MQNEPKLTPRRAEIVAAIRAGRLRPYTIARELKCSHNTVSVQLHGMVRSGVVVRTGRGTYALPEPTAQ